MMRGEGIRRRWFSIIGGAVTALLVPLREVLGRAEEDMIIFFVCVRGGGGSAARYGDRYRSQRAQRRQTLPSVNEVEVFFFFLF